MVNKLQSISLENQYAALCITTLPVLFWLFVTVSGGLHLTRQRNFFSRKNSEFLEQLIYWKLHGVRRVSVTYVSSESQIIRRIETYIYVYLVIELMWYKTNNTCDTCRLLHRSCVKVQGFGKSPITFPAPVWYVRCTLFSKVCSHLRNWLLLN